MCKVPLRVLPSGWKQYDLLLCQEIYICTSNCGPKWLRHKLIPWWNTDRPSCHSSSLHMDDWYAGNIGLSLISEWVKHCMYLTLWEDVFSLCKNSSIFTAVRGHSKFCPSWVSSHEFWWLAMFDPQSKLLTPFHFCLPFLCLYFLWETESHFKSWPSLVHICILGL